MRHTIRQGAVVAAAVIALGSLTACGASDNPGAAPPSAAQSSAPSPAPTPTLTDPDTGEGTAPDLLPSPSTDAASDAAALALATKAMTAFARPQVPAPQWWADLLPFLSNPARRAYADTDPANVSAHGVTGPATLAAPVSGYLATAQVPTDVGVWTLLLSRPGQNAPWNVERFTPPAGIH
jgi:hypothetical protein